MFQIACALLHNCGNSITVNAYHTLYPWVFRVCVRLSEHNHFDSGNLDKGRIELLGKHDGHTILWLGQWLRSGLLSQPTVLLSRPAWPLHQTVTYSKTPAYFLLGASSLKRRRVRLVAEYEVCCSHIDGRAVLSHYETAISFH
jgi:hypothetical protein